MASELACRKLTAKSRSDEVSMLLGTTREKPSAAASAAVSMA